MNRSCYCVWDLQSTDRSSALSELLSRTPHTGSHTRELLLRALEAREAAGATLVSEDIAMPHCRSTLVEDLVIILGRSPAGIGWPEEPARTIILFITPVRPSGPQEHLELISHIADRIRNSPAGGLAGAAGPSELAGMLGFELTEDGPDASGSREAH